MAIEKHAKPIIGIIGGIGSGKSAVASLFADLGCAIIDSDQIAQDALRKSETISKIVQLWGKSLLDTDNSINAQKLASIVFTDPDKLNKLEQLIHPQVHQARTELRKQYLCDVEIPAIVEDCPLLIEKGLDKQCDIVIFIDTDREIRLRRVVNNRGWTPQQLAQREKKQIPLDIKAKSADYVIDNNADLEDCMQHIRRIFSLIIKNHKQ